MVNLVLSVKGKILMTVVTVVLMFALFILFYFPARQEKYLLENYNEEIENFAQTVALGVKIALTEQNFEGVETAIDFVRHDERLLFVSLIQTDTIRANISDRVSINVEKTVFKSFPEGVSVDPNAVSNDRFIIKNAPFSTPVMSGAVMLSFSTDEIIKSRNQIWVTSIIASIVVFLIGLFIGYWLARNISKPVLALRDAANRVGEGDLTQSVNNQSRDEIGELSIAFNKMVKVLGNEAALDQVRKKTTEMQKSEDLSIVTSALFDEMERVGLTCDFCGIGIIDGQHKEVTQWTGNIQGSDDTTWVWSDFSLSGHPLFDGLYSAWLSQESFAYVLEGKNLQKFYNVIAEKGFHFPADILKKSLDQPLQYSYHVMFATGVLSIFRDKSFDEGNFQTMQRFAEVYHQAFIRFQDMQQSEARVREEIKQASLDRVRGEIASMRTKEDLTRITPLIWKELTLLNVPFIRCGVFIVDESEKTVQSFLSAPDGRSLGIFNLSLDNNEFAKQIVDHWRQHVGYHEHWNERQFVKFMQNLIEQGHIKSQETYQGAVNPPDSLDLHFSPFKQGMLYVGNTSPLANDDLQLVQSLAEAFSIAYARYEDFNQLEEAKNKMELTLTELKSTQSQLIHAEKMASLGELTAGIAHEIQNPLNFVNNFSEVSIDLIEEMHEEIKKGNEEEVNLITADLKQNLGKINHHGKRASSIVKGMLEHSRTSKREKELTDVNLLADEYLRLAYHGLRAKDKTFNAEFKAELDETLPKINIISLDIGRVLLNLINNAFYAVSMKSKKDINGYKPRVVISTKKLKNQIEIRVKDNADGIPPDVMDKIFQPFFTTKPTGQGTGLGLSISYDIITKGHNGALRINTKLGKGTEFIIELPQ